MKEAGAVVDDRTIAKSRLLVWRRVGLAMCLALAAADDFAAVTVVGPSPASHLADMEQDPEDAAIVARAIDLARRLGVEVVAEGVERASTLEAITAMGAHYAQRYGIGRPLAPSAFDPWIYERRGLRAIVGG